MISTVREIVREFPAVWPSEQSLYGAIRAGVLPAGVVVRIGRHVVINRQKLLAWFDSGGSALAGGWRREVA